MPSFSFALSQDVDIIYFLIHCTPRSHAWSKKAQMVRPSIINVCLAQVLDGVCQVSRAGNVLKFKI